MQLYVLVFVSGATVMIVEIVAARFLAPYIGTSVIVWTCVIGVIMAGLSLGYMLGGRLGDRWKSYGRLQMIVYAAAMWIALLAVFRNVFLLALTAVAQGPAMLAIVSTGVLLFAPSMLLGIVSPYAVRLAARDVAHVGRVAGNLSALSTAGSIVGTFVAGFALIPSFGTTAILLSSAAVLGCTALLRPTVRGVVACLLFLVFLWGLATAERMLQTRLLGNQSILAEVDSQYAVIRVRQLGADVLSTGLTTRFLEIDHGYHSAYAPDAPDEHVFNYTEYYRLVDVLRPTVGRALLLGGGGYTVARDFLRRHPEGRLDVVEIDPTVTALARQYFGLADDARMNIIHEDARMFLNREAGGLGKGAYQVVFGDAFRSELTIPFHLTTMEAAQRIHALLDSDGVYILNIVSSEEGENSRLLLAEVATLQRVFPQVLAFRVPHPTGFVGAEDFENITLIASKAAPDETTMRQTKDPGLSAMLANRIDLSGMEEVAVLTDDYAPVEAMLNL